MGGMIKLTAPALALTLAASSVGCAGQTEDSAGRAPDTTHALAEGLTIEARTIDSIAGRYHAGPGEVRFLLTKSDGARTIVVTSLAGESLLTSRIENGIESVTLFDGRLRVSGRVGAFEPDIEGDPRASEDLAARRDSEALSDLPRALDQSFPGALDLESTGLTTQIAPPGSLPPSSPRPRPDLSAFWLKLNQSKSFVGWQYSQRIYWAASTADPSNCITIKTGVDVVSKHCIAPPSYSSSVTGYWYNRSVTIKNVGAGTYGNDLLINVY